MRYNILAVVLSVLFLANGCVKVNVKNVDSSGKVTSDVNYYPLSKQKDIQRWDGITPLHLYAAKDNSGRIKELLAHGSDPFAYAVVPTNNQKVTPLDLAAMLKHQESTKVLAEYILKNYRSRLNRDKDLLATVLSRIWYVDPLYTLELTSKYGYEKWKKHALNKLMHQSKYHGPNGLVELAREVAHLGYSHALGTIYRYSDDSVNLAFIRDVHTIENSWQINSATGEKLHWLETYKKYIPLNYRTRALPLIERYNSAVDAQHARMRKMLADAFSPSKSDHSCGAYKDKCLRYCEGKSESSHGLSLGDASDCRTGCDLAWRACLKGNEAAWKVGTCHAICKGVDQTDGGLLPFSSSSFDGCVNRCEVEFFR